MGGHTVNRDVGYGVHSYINLKILGGHVPVCPPYEYGPAFQCILRGTQPIGVKGRRKEKKKRKEEKKRAVPRAAAAYGRQLKISIKEDFGKISLTKSFNYFL